MVFGGAEELGAESKHAEGGGGEVASSSSSITLAFTVAAEEENSESSRDGVRRSTALRGGVESNLNRSVKFDQPHYPWGIELQDKQIRA